MSAGTGQGRRPAIAGSVRAARRPEEGRTVTPGEYAEHRGCGRQSVVRAINEGRITPDEDGSLDPQKCDAAWAKNSREDRTKPNGHAVPASPTLAASRRRKMLV